MIIATIISIIDVDTILVEDTLGRRFKVSISSSNSYNVGDAVRILSGIVIGKVKAEKAVNYLV